MRTLFRFLTLLSVLFSLSAQAQPTARIMWDFFKQYRRDPETKKLIYEK